MHTERTPNPNSVKWVLETEILNLGHPVAFDLGTSPGVSPLAARVMGVCGVVGVLLSERSVTVNKQPAADWRELGKEISGAIRDWAEAGEPALGPDYRPPPARDDEDVLERIRSILENEIAVYVAQDGGEITLEGFDHGVVRVRLKGACEGCPSSAITLKMGVEARLRQEIPEVQSVEAI